MSKKSLVAYFSASGVTARAAKTLAEAAGADLYEIKPKTPYTKADLNWMDKNARSSIEMNDPSSRPEIADQNADIASYDVIFLGYPNWNADLPMPLYTFLEEYDFSGKTIIPFTVHGGSGFSRTIDTIAELEPDAQVEEDGLAISRNAVPDAEGEVTDWLSGLGI